MSGFCQSQVHIAAAAPVTLLLSQDGSEEDEADADDADDADGDADCCWCWYHIAAAEMLLLVVKRFSVWGGLEWLELVSL